MDPFTLALLGGAVFLIFSTKKKSRKSSLLRPGDHQVKIGVEYKLQLPRDAGYWQKIPVGGPPAADIMVFAHKDDPLNVGRILPKAPGLMKVSFFTDEGRRDLVAEFLFDVRA